MAGMRDIKRRIKSVQGTRKITRAMQMVSAAKMKRAQMAALSSRTYATMAWELILNLSKTREITSSLLKTHPKAQKLGVLLLSTNKGMVGSLNANLMGKLEQLSKETGLEIEVVAYGNKGREGAARFHKNIVADFAKIDKNPSAEDVYPISRMLVDLYQTGQYQRIVIVYNHFVSTLTQKPMVRQLLPFAPSIINKHDQEELKRRREEGEEVLKETGYNYVFEPDPKKVLRHLLPRILESQIFQTILESEASEHSARMIMMKNATDAAGDLISDLTLTYNQIRQGKITSELAEITAGKIALE